METAKAKRNKSHVSILSFNEERRPGVVEVRDKLLIELYLPLICKSFSCSTEIRVAKEYIRENYYMYLKQMEGAKRSKRISIAVPSGPPHVSMLNMAEDGCSTINNDNTDKELLRVTAIYDNLDRLVEIALHKLRFIPRVLMQVLTLLVPNYTHLEKITVRNCRNNVYVMQELSKMLPISSITEVCLDDSPLLEANYSILLDNTSNLQNLSLCRCKVNDTVCEMMASKLHHNAVSEKQLLLLNLTSNRITDLGVKHFGEALRTNRYLRYLNLSDNYITDEGAAHILDVLIDFPLTIQEISNKRRRCMQYLKAKYNLYFNFINQLDSCSLDESHKTLKSEGKKIPQKRKKYSAATVKLKGIKKDREKVMYDDLSHIKAEMMVDQLLGPFNDPFSASFLIVKNGLTWCKGNMGLTYLNISYNNLSYLSIKKILKVLEYQSLAKAPSQVGLLNILFEGNPLESCSEISTIEGLLNRNVIRYAGKRTSEISRRKSRNKNK